MDHIQSKKVVIDNLLINYYQNDVQASNKTVLFVHGWLSESTVWFHLMHALTKAGYRCLAIDLPGFGQSQIPQNSVDNNFYVDILREFIAKLDLNNIVLVGHSNGGAICTKFLNSKKDAAIQLILIDSAGIRTNTASKSLKRFIAKILKPIFKLGFLRPLRTKIYNLIGSEDYVNSEYLQNSYKNVIDDDISDLFKNIEIPTLIIWGQDDKATPIRFAEFIYSQIKDSKLEVIKAGHFPFLDKPNDVINQIITFIK